MKLSIVAFLCGACLGHAAGAEPALITSDSLPDNLARGAAVTTNSPGPPGHDIKAIVDGDRGANRSWWAERALPVWVLVDLGATKTFNRMQLFWPSDGKRYYQYHVEVSDDKEAWERIIDDTDMNTAATDEGITRTFPSCRARYIKLTVVGSYAAYKTAHLSELEVYPPAPVTRTIDLAEHLSRTVTLDRGDDETGSIYRGPVLATDGTIIAPTEGEVRTALLPGWLQFEPVRFWIRFDSMAGLRTVGTGVRAAVDERARVLHLLVGHSPVDGPVPCSLQVTFADGTEETASLDAGKAAFSLSVDPVRLTCLSWTNPRPELVIKNVRLSTGDDSPQIGLAAVTCTLTDFEWRGPAERYDDYCRAVRTIEAARDEMPAALKRGAAYARIADRPGNIAADLVGTYVEFADTLVADYETTLSRFRQFADTNTAAFDELMGAAAKLQTSPQTGLKGLAQRIPDLATALCGETDAILASVHASAVQEKFNDRSATHAGRRTGYFVRLALTYRNKAGKLLRAGGSDHVAERALNYAHYALAYAKLARDTWQARPDVSPWDIPGPKALTATEDKRAVPRQRTCLNGVWEMATGGPDTPPADGWSTKRVPHLPDLPDRSVWYRTAFEMPGDWRGGRVRVRFDAVTAYCEVFVNGRYCGNSYFGYVPFTVDVTEALRPGRNWLHVYVVNSTYTQLLGSTGPRSMVNHYPTGAEAYARLTGIWQDVYLETVPLLQARIGLINTSIQNRRLDVPVEVTNATPGQSPPVETEVRLRVLDGSRTVLQFPSRKLPVAPGRTETVAFSAAWEEAKLWGIGGEYGDPNLYFLEASLWRDGECLDKVTERFGFRQFAIRGKHFVLNGRTIPVQGYPLIYDPWHGQHIANAEYLRRNFRLGRQANFNMVRFFFPTYARFYDVADEMGVLIQPQLFPNDCIRGIDGQTDYEDPVANGIAGQFYQAWVRQLGNHPSVVIWSTENELLAAGVSPDSPTERRENFARHVDYWKRIDAVVKQTDPQRRPIQHHGCQGIIGSPYQAMLEIADFHYPQANMVWAWRKSNPDMPLFFGEWNCTGGVANPPRSVAAAALAQFPGQARSFLAFCDAVQAAGQQVHFAPAIASFIDVDDSLRGPWPDLVNRDGERATVSVPWPSLSGWGDRVPALRAGYPIYGYHINWFDPDRPEMTPNALDEAFRLGQKPMPPVPPTVPPELLVTVTQNGAPVPGTTVTLTGLDGQPLPVDGVVTDPNGIAWFWTCLPGRYRVAAMRNGSLASTDVTLGAMATDAKPGWEHIPRTELRIP